QYCSAVTAGPDPLQSLARSKYRTAASPDLILANALCCTPGLGQRMSPDQLKRREFITLLGGAAAWPLTGAGAQQPEIPTIGFLSAGSPDDSAPVLTVLRQGLKDAGLLEGHKVRLEFRWAQDQPDRLPALAAELVEQNVALIFAVTNAAAYAAKLATSTIPIVFAIGGEPVSLGLVSSIEAPGGNATGITARLPG